MSNIIKEQHIRVDGDDDDCSFNSTFFLTEYASVYIISEHDLIDDEEYDWREFNKKEYSREYVIGFFDGYVAGFMTEDEDTDE